MNKGNIRLWVEALRSGEYEQTTGGLSMGTTDDGPRKHCCLGVACEVAMKNGVDMQVSRRSYPFYDEYSDTEESGFLPGPVMDWLGFTTYSPEVWTGEGNKALAYLNDEYGLNFDRIADRIEATYLTEDTK